MTKQTLPRSADLRLTWGGPKSDENTDHVSSTSTYSRGEETLQDIPICPTCGKCYFGRECDRCLKVAGADALIHGPRFEAAPPAVEPMRKITGPRATVILMQCRLAWSPEATVTDCRARA